MRNRSVSVHHMLLRTVGLSHSLLTSLCIQLLHENNTTSIQSLSGHHQSGEHMALQCRVLSRSCFPLSIFFPILLLHSEKEWSHVKRKEAIGSSLRHTVHQFDDGPLFKKVTLHTVEKLWTFQGWITRPPAWQLLFLMCQRGFSGCVIFEHFFAGLGCVFVYETVRMSVCILWFSSGGVHGHASASSTIAPAKMEANRQFLLSSRKNYWAISFLWIQFFRNP